MSKQKPENGAKGAELDCKCGGRLFRIIAWCGGHVDLTCSQCGSVIDHGDIVVEHTVKTHDPNQPCPECNNSGHN